MSLCLSLLRRSQSDEACSVTLGTPSQTAYTMLSKVQARSPTMSYMSLKRLVETSSKPSKRLEMSISQKRWTIPVNIGTPGKVTNIVNEQGLAAAHVKLDCISCFIAGSFAITGRLSVKLFIMADFVLTAAPQDLAAELVIAADITAFKRPDMLKYDLDLFSAPIPDAGIVVPGILNLGLTAKYRLAVHTNFSGGAQLDFGLKASIPNGAQLTADFGHADQSGAKGWEGAKLDPVFDLKALTSAVKFAAANQPMLVFGVEIVKVAQFDVELNLKLPQVQATFTGIYNESGACPGNSSKTGVSLSSDVDIDLSLQIQSRLGDKKKLLYTKPLVVFWKLPLLKKCWPFNVPGLGPANPSTPEIPELPAPDAPGIPNSPSAPVSVSSAAMATPMVTSQVSTSSAVLSRDVSSIFSVTSVTSSISSSISISSKY